VIGKDGCLWYPLRMYLTCRLAALAILALIPSVALMGDPATSTNPAPVTPPAATPPPSAAPDVTQASPSLYNFTANSLDGKPVDLSQYKGRVALVVNTASNCGFTPQYAGLEKLYEDYKDKGFVVLGFPSNDFGHQEPGTSKDIAKLCSTKFHVSFPMFEKIKTRGDGQSPVYQFLTTGHGQPQWNFHKYLVDKTGKVIGEFPSQVAPDNKDLRDAIDAALKG
jgi:glutathione peroxidase